MRQTLGRATHLRSPAHARAAQLAEERQEACGGTLDTAVLELGLVSEEALVPLLGKAADLPVAHSEMVTAADTGLAAILPQLLAEKHGIAPVSLERRQLSLLVENPIALTVLDEIGFLLSRPLRALRDDRAARATAPGAGLSALPVRSFRDAPAHTPDARGHPAGSAGDDRIRGPSAARPSVSAAPTPPAPAASQMLAPPLQASPAPTPAANDGATPLDESPRTLWTRPGSMPPTLFPPRRYRTPRRRFR